MGLSDGHLYIVPEHDAVSDSNDFVLSSSVSVRGCGAVICIIKAEKGKRKAHINL